MHTKNSRLISLNNLNSKTNVGSIKKRYIISNRPCLHKKKEKEKEKIVGCCLTTKEN